MPARQHRLTTTCLILTTALLATALTACKSSGSNSSEQSVALNGAGSTFVYPVMSRWTRDYATKHPDTQINYQSIGSGGGVQQVKSGTVDFGASDNPLDDTALATMKPMLQIPETAGPVCITYNLPGISQPLQLSAEAIAGMFLGKITTWQDPTSRSS
jgi:phosphate transport system substrate-binding protein